MRKYRRLNKPVPLFLPVAHIKSDLGLGHTDRGQGGFVHAACQTFFGEGEKVSPHIVDGPHPQRDSERHSVNPL